MRLKKPLASAIFFQIFILCLPASAAIDRGVLSVDEVIQEVLTRNPQYQAQKYNVTAFKQKSLSASSWENPRIGVRLNKTPDNTFLTEARQKRMFIMQKFPFPGKLTLRGKVVKKQEEIESSNLEDLKFDLMRKASKIYFEFYFLNRSIQVKEEHQRLLGKFQKIANQKYSVGTASQQDVLKALVELARLSNDLITLHQDKVSIQARLNALMNRLPREPLGKPQDPKIVPLKQNLEELENLALNYRPAIKADSLEVEKQKKDRLLAKLSYAPDFFTRFEIWLNRDRNNQWAGEFGVTIPLWFFNKQIPQVKEATSKYYRAQAKLQNTKNKALFEINDAYVRVNTAERLIELYKTTVLVQARQSLRAAESGYQADTVDFLDLIDSQRVLEDFKLEYYRALADYPIAVSELEAAVGKKLR